MAISRHGRSRLLLLGCEEPSPFLPSKKLAESSKSTRCVEQVCSPRQPILFFWSNFGSQGCATAASATLALLLGCNLRRKSAQRLLEILLRFMATLSQVFSKGIANMFSRRASSHSHNSHLELRIQKETLIKLGYAVAKLGLRRKAVPGFLQRTAQLPARRLFTKSEKEQLDAIKKYCRCSFAEN